MTLMWWGYGTRRKRPRADPIEGRRVVALMTAVIGLCRILTITDPAGKLEI
jgi:hypothetical protein